MEGVCTCSVVGLLQERGCIGVDAVVLFGKNVKSEKLNPFTLSAGVFNAIIPLLMVASEIRFCDETRLRCLGFTSYLRTFCKSDNCIKNNSNSN